MLFFAFLGVAWNLLGGYAGQFSFGHAAFFGIGAYTSTLLLVRLGLSPWLGFLAGGVARRRRSAASRATSSFRYGLRGPYFALVTLAFAEMLRLVALNWMAVGGPMGILIPLPRAGEALWRLQFADKLPYYYLMLALLGLALWLNRTDRARPARPRAGGDPGERGRRRGVGRRHPGGQAPGHGVLRLPHRARRAPSTRSTSPSSTRRSRSGRPFRSRSCFARSSADPAPCSAPCSDRFVLTPLSELTRVAHPRPRRRRRHGVRRRAGRRDHVPAGRPGGRVAPRAAACGGA